MSQHKKTVYRCQVLGGKGCGKSSFVRGLVGKALEEVPEEVQVEESMSIRSLTLPSSAAPVYLLVGLAQEDWGAPLEGSVGRAGVLQWGGGGGSAFTLSLIILIECSYVLDWGNASRLKVCGIIGQAKRAPLIRVSSRF